MKLRNLSRKYVVDARSRQDQSLVLGDSYVP